MAFFFHLFCGFSPWIIQYAWCTVIIEDLLNLFLTLNAPMDTSQNCECYDGIVLPAVLHMLNFIVACISVQLVP